MEERTLLGASVTYRDPDSRWSATLYGTNLTDETYRVAALPVAGLWNFTNYGAPRQIGVSAEHEVRRVRQGGGCEPRPSRTSRATGTAETTP